MVVELFDGMWFKCWCVVVVVEWLGKFLSLSLEECELLMDWVVGSMVL